MTALLHDLEAYTAIPAPSGHERDLAGVVEADWAEIGVVERDRLGTLSTTIGAGDPHVMLAAHLDEVGFVVRRIDGDGFVRLHRLGGVPERVLTMQPIVLLGRDGPVEGVIGTPPHHFTDEDEKYRVPRIEDTYLDIGADGREQVEGWGIHVGDVGAYRRSFVRNGRVVRATALDDRAGLAALTAVGRALASDPPDHRVSLVASVQEEFSVRAVVPTVRRLAPDVLVAVDVSPATDTPEMAGRNSHVALGAGPVVHLHSFHGRGTLAGVLPPGWLVDAITETAADVDVPLQRATFFGGLTDGSFAQLEHDGIPTVELGIPVRYTHAPFETCHGDDLEHLVTLLAALCRRDLTEGGR